jgi:hypothetical protein
MVRIYCGTKKTPRGRVAGTKNQCYVIGRKSGFVGGISKNDITKKEIVEMGNDINQRSLQALAKALGMRQYAFKKSDLLPLIVAHDWTRINAKKVLLNM